MDNQIVFNETGHRELWQWLVDNPMKNKEDWPGWDYNGGTYDSRYNDCFACSFVKKLDGCGEGEGCPLEWPEQSCMEYGKSIYERWDNSLDPTERSTLAAQIRDLKVKPGVVCI